MEDINFTQKTQKNSKYTCTYCNFMTGNKNDYKRHLFTSKHLINVEKHDKDTNGYEKDIHFTQTTLSKCFCGKEYKHSSGLWRHKKKCTALNDNNIEEPLLEKEITSVIPAIDMNVIMGVLQKNQEFQEIMMEQNKQLMEQNKLLVEKVGNNDIRKKCKKIKKM